MKTSEALVILVTTFRFVFDPSISELDCPDRQLAARKIHPRILAVRLIIDF